MCAALLTPVSTLEHPFVSVATTACPSMICDGADLGSTLLVVKLALQAARVVSSCADPAHPSAGHMLRSTPSPKTPSLRTMSRRTSSCQSKVLSGPLSQSLCDFTHRRHWQPLNYVVHSKAPMILSCFLTSYQHMLCLLPMSLLSSVDHIKIRFRSQIARFNNKTPGGLSRTLHEPGVARRPGAVAAAHRSGAAGCLDKMGHHEVWNSHNNTHSKGGRGW